MDEDIVFFLERLRDSGPKKGSTWMQLCTWIALARDGARILLEGKTHAKQNAPRAKEGPRFNYPQDIRKLGECAVLPFIPDPRDATKPPDVNLRSVLKKGSEAKA